MIKPSDCTIIIPHLGGTLESEYALDQCMESLLETSPRDIKGPLVVTNGNHGQCEHKTKKRVPFSMDLIQQGQCKAVNAAAATVNTKWIFVTNDDMIYPPGWWEKMTEFQTSLCMSPRLVEPRLGAPTFITEFCGGAGGDFDKQKWLKFAEEYMKGQYTQEKGFNLPFLISRELWNIVEGYDIEYDPFGSNSDSDLEYKIRLAGVQPMQVRNCVVYHFSQTSGTFHPDNQSYWQKNWDYFIEKWGFPRTDEGIWEANFKMPTRQEGRKFQPVWERTYGD